MRYVYGHDDVVNRFIAALVPHVPARGCETPFTSMAIADDAGDMIGGVIWHNYSKEFRHIEVAMAALRPRAWSRETYRRIYEYPFDQLDCFQVLHVIPKHDGTLHIRNVLARLGCWMTDRPYLFGPNCDGVEAGLTREAWQNCKFNRERNLYIDRTLQIEQMEAA